MRTLPRWIFVFVCSAFTGLPAAQVWGQEARNLIRNPSFESAGARANPWYGTSQDGTIQLAQGQVPVLTEAGAIGGTSMPVSVSLGDLNGDGLNDILAAGPDGYMFVYFNSGSKTEPKFTTGELLPIFIPQLPEPGSGAAQTPLGERARAPRVHLADMGGNRLDIWMGTYAGLILRLPNSGSANTPGFAQPRDLPSVLIPTSTDPTRRWGNVFAPALWDFNADGKKDLLVGEGSYSANSIHILLNEGSNSSPRFLDTNRHVLAYGMGREQLTPAVVDYNGDGQPDLLVADRSGQIGLYSSAMVPEDEAAKADNLSTQQAGGRAAGAEGWKPGTHLPFVTYLQAGGAPFKVAGIPTVAAGELTGHGTFDLVIGQNNGRIALVRNTGTKTEPKFERPVTLKGDPTPPIFGAQGWEIDFGQNRGNFFGVAQAMDNQENAQVAPPDGARALRLGYMPNKNTVLKSNFVWPPLLGQPPRAASGATPTVPTVRPTSPANVFSISQNDIPLEFGARYTLTFQVKGRNVVSAQGAISSQRKLELQKARQEQVGRGAVRNVGGETLQGNFVQPIQVRVGPNWNTVTTSFQFNFTEDRQLNEPEGSRNTNPAQLILIFELTPGTGEVFLDNFSLTKQ